MLVRQLILFFVSIISVFQLTAQPQLIAINGPDTSPRLNGLFELNIQLITSVDNPYNFNTIRLFGIFKSPDGQTFEQDGFLYQHFESENGLLVPSGDPYWKIRFTPRQSGSWTFQVKVVDDEGFDISETASFECLKAENPGFVSFDEDSHYLVDDQGNTIFLVGENIAWAEYQSGNDRMHLYMEGLAGSGANFAKLMMVPWSYSIEWGTDGLMNYANRQDRAFMLDSVFRMARNYGLYMQLAFSIHDELRDGYAGEDWESNPYNQTNGGPCAEPRDFFSNPLAKEFFKNRMRYISARWGYEPLLFGWELLSESDNFPSYSQFADEVAIWAGQMAEHMKEIDPNKHPVSIGFALTTSNPDVWNHPEIGFTQLHYYTERPDIEGEIFRMTGVYRDTYNKAVLVGEYGIGYIMDSIIAKDPDGWALHNGLWTSALSGSFGSIVPWYWDAYIHDLELYYRFTGISNFMRNETLDDDIFTPTHLTTITEARHDFVITPDFDELTQKAPSGNYTLPSTGLLLPAEDSLGTLLFGPLSVFARLRNPPVFSGTWSQNSVMIIETGSQVNGGVLQVKFNDLVVFEQAVVAGGIYHIDVPAGEHHIMIDNIGTNFLSIIELERIIFSDYLPEIRAFGLLSDNYALVWVHNTNNNWHWYRQQNEPPGAVSGELLLPFYSGLFQVDKWNTLTGMMEESHQFQATETGLLAPIEALSTDMALKISFITSVTANKMPEERRMTVFPNPSSGRVTFATETLAGETLSLEICDLYGRIVHEQKKSWPEAGLKQLLWEPDRKGKGSKVYVYRLTAGIKHYTGKLIVE